jgi:hypothetical protein
MGNRAQILRDLIELTRPVAVLRREPAELPRDSAELAQVDPARVTMVPNRYLSRDLSQETIAQWADALEGRDDVGYDKRIADVLSELASPEINGALTPERARELIALLS